MSKHGILLCHHYFLALNRRSPIHAEAPEFIDMSVEQEILVTGIKVVDLLAPYVKGGKIGKFKNRFLLQMNLEKGACSVPVPYMKGLRLQDVC